MCFVVFSYSLMTFPTDRRRANRWPNYYFTLITCSCLAWRGRALGNRETFSPVPHESKCHRVEPFPEQRCSFGAVAGRVVDLFLSIRLMNPLRRTRLSRNNVDLAEKMLVHHKFGGTV